MFSGKEALGVWNKPQFLCPAYFLHLNPPTIEQALAGKLPCSREKRLLVFGTSHGSYVLHVSCTFVQENRLVTAIWSLALWTCLRQQ